jgi:hypothetical protein
VLPATECGRLSAGPYAHPEWGPKLRSPMSAAPVPTRRVWLGVFMLIATAALWSLAGPLIKLLKEAGVDGVAIAFYRSAFGGVVFLPLALRRLGTLRNVSILWPIGSVVAFTAMTVTFVIATTMTAAANAIILQYTSPIWVFLLAPLLLKERPGQAEGLVLLIAMAGVAIIFFGHGAADIPWLAVALASGLGFGTLIVVLRGLRRVNPVVVGLVRPHGPAARAAAHAGPGAVHVAVCDVLVGVAVRGSASRGADRPVGADPQPALDVPDRCGGAATGHVHRRSADTAECCGLDPADLAA